MKKQIALISEQPLPVIYGIWQQKPDFVSFLVTEGYKGVVENIVSVAEQNHKFKYDVVHVDPYDKEKMKHYFSNLDDKSNWSVNVTGGTKIMSILATMYGSQLKAEIFYVKPSEHKEEIIYPFSSGESQTIEFKLNIEQYLKAHGKNIHSFNSEIDLINKRFPLTNFIANNNWVIKFLEEMRATWHDKGIRRGDVFFKEHKHHFMRMTFIKPKKTKLKKGLKDIQIEYGLVSHPAEIIIKQDTYISGAWLEDYIYFCIKNDADDSLLNVEIESKNKKGLNEIDVMAIKNNRLHIISCKTGKKLQNASQYELIHYKNIAGGIYAKPYLISISTPGPMILERIADYKIKTVFGKNIKNFQL